MSLPDEEITLAEALKQHGYATANYGKAHLRKDPKTYGFDEAITGPRGARRKWRLATIPPTRAHDDLAQPP